MNTAASYRIGLIRRPHPWDISGRTKAIEVAVDEGNTDALLSFAEYLAEEGELGDVAELSLEMTVRQLVELQITNASGRASLRTWARMLAEEQCAEGIAE